MPIQIRAVARLQVTEHYDKLERSLLKVLRLSGERESFNQTSSTFVLDQKPDEIDVSHINSEFGLPISRGKSALREVLVWSVPHEFNICLSRTLPGIKPPKATLEIYTVENENEN